MALQERVTTLEKRIAEVVELQAKNERGMDRLETNMDRLEANAELSRAAAARDGLPASTLPGRCHLAARVDSMFYSAC